MEAKIEKISELSKLLSVKTRMSDDLFHLFGKFGIGHLLSRLSLEKQDGVSASELLLSLCLFRIVGESIHSICKHKIYELSNHGKNCFYRMMIRPQMDWRRLMNHFALRYMCLLRKYGEAPLSDTTTCFIIDDIVLENHVLSHKGKGQMRPSEVIVLYVEVLFACSTLIVECNDVLLGRCPVIGKDTAVCVYHSEHIRLLLALLVFLVFQSPTLRKRP